RILVLPFGGGEDIESFLNIDYFDSSGRMLYLIIDSDKHEDKFDKQTQRANLFTSGKQQGKAHVINKSCIENYYHPRAIERVYGLERDTFSFFGESDNVRKLVKQVISENNLEKKSIKEKNNLRVFEEMTQEEWNEVIEPELKDFLSEILH